MNAGPSRRVRSVVHHCAIALAVALSSSATAQTRVPVLQTFPLQEHVPTCQTGTATLESLLQVRFVREGDPQQCILSGPNERSLAALARRGALRSCPGLRTDLPAHCRGPNDLYVLPYSAALVLGYDPARLAAREVPETWEELAQRSDLRDRIGLPDPRLEAAPWLAAMEHRLARGDEERSGYALWTSLDAQAGTYFTDYEAMFEALRTGRIAIAIAPRPFFDLCVDEKGLPLFANKPLREHIPIARYGIAVGASVPSAGDKAAAEVSHFHAPLGLHAVQPEDVGTATDWDEAERRLAHFEAMVRGKGREVESIADALDVAFGLAFLAFVLVAWRKLRKQEASETPPPA